MGLDDALVRCGLAASKTKARQFVGDGAVSVNGERVGPDRHLGADDLLHDRVVLLRRGKRQWGMLRVEG
jgi:tyrosyl-tRNA synthetase